MQAAKSKHFKRLSISFVIEHRINPKMETIKINKADLEGKRTIFFEIGLIIALIAVYFVFSLKVGTHNDTLADDVTLVTEMEEMVPVTVQEEPPPPPPKPPQVISRITIVDNDIEVAQEQLDINAAADQETVIPEYVPYTPVEEPEEEIETEQPIFVVVESMPQFPGGIQKLLEYLHSNIRYPVLAKESNIQGKVFVSFVVEKDGSVTDVKVLRGIGGGCDEEAIRVVSQMPKWIPGRQRDVPVRVRYNLPIKFVLQ